MLNYTIKTFNLFPVRIVLVESIPEGLEFNSSVPNPSIYNAWLNLMAEARSSIDIASFYWTLTNEDTGTQEPTASQVSPRCEWFKEMCLLDLLELLFTAVWIMLGLLCAQGEAVLKTLAELSGELSVRIAVNTPQRSQPQEDLRLLNRSGDSFTLRVYECMFACNMVWMWHRGWSRLLTCRKSFNYPSLRIFVQTLSCVFEAKGSNIWTHCCGLYWSLLCLCSRAPLLFWKTYFCSNTLLPMSLHRNAATDRRFKNFAVLWNTERFVRQWSACSAFSNSLG